MKKIAKTSIGIGSKHFQFILMLMYGLTIRLILINPNSIPFTFDHGKDSLAILHMIHTLSPKLIGPWTSIPGLYFGPGWYYLMAPAYIIGNGHPIAPVIQIILLTLLVALIAYKFLGNYTTLLILTSPAWIGISTSAWNPFPIAWTTLLIIVVLSKQKNGIPLTSLHVGLLAFFASLGFHFSSAYAVFFLITLPLILLYRIKYHRQSISLKTSIIGLVAFIIPFLPQLIFELRHNFIQTRSIYNYLFVSNISNEKYDLLFILKEAVGQFNLTVFPHLPHTPTIVNTLYLLAATWLVFYAIVKKYKPRLLVELLILIIIPIVGFTQLHFNIWYLTALLPVFTYLGAQLIGFQPKIIRVIFVVLILVSPAIKVADHLSSNAALLNQKRDFLAIKIKALDYIYKDAGDDSFSSYQYAPHIYDFDWQYMYFWYALKGYRLPVEFSYMPGAFPYIPEKAELLTKFAPVQENPKLIYYIVEKPQDDRLLADWWNQQKNQKIIDEYKISPEVTIYKALP